MSKLTMYCDGSENQYSIPNTIRQAWGVVALHHGKVTVEFNGCIDSHQNANAVGFYEMLAFYAAIEYAESYGFIPGEVSFYTDDAWCAYSGFKLVHANYAGESKTKVIKRIKKFQQKFYRHDPTVVMRMIRWLTGSQIHWVKGHDNHVHNCRADYLARSAVKEKDPISFFDWISQGIESWGSRTFLPFSKPAL